MSPYPAVTPARAVTPHSEVTVALSRCNLGLGPGRSCPQRRRYHDQWAVCWTQATWLDGSFLLFGVTADIITLVMPSSAAGLWQAPQPAMALIGWALQRLVLERSARGGLLVPVLSTFGLSIILDNLLFQGFGADTRSLAPYIGDLSYDSW